MSQEWMKVEKATLGKPEVFRIASYLKITHYCAFGMCFQVWSYFDTHTTDGVLSDTEKEFVDLIVSHPGFADAMISVRWLVEKDGNLILPNFKRHNGETAKKRSLGALRTSRCRSRKRVTQDVTHEACTETLPDKNRIDKNTPLTPQGGNGKLKRKREYGTDEEERAAILAEIEKRHGKDGDE